MRTAWLSLVLISLGLGLVVAARVGTEPVATGDMVAATAPAPGRARVEVQVLPTATPSTPLPPTLEVTLSPRPTTASPTPPGSVVPSAPVVPSGSAGRPPTGTTSMGGVAQITTSGAGGAGGMPRTGVAPHLPAWLAGGTVAVAAGLVLVLVARRRRDRTG
jgi:hypothetical protein